MATKLFRIAQKARKEPDTVFHNLYHLLKPDLLRECYQELRKNAACGIDGVTKQEYGEHLEENVADLSNRLQRMAYIPQPVRRAYIPKPGSDKLRPLGIPALEDKIVQAALSRILEQVYEPKFIASSYGSRRGRSPHDALRDLSDTVESGRIEWIVEADIKGFFDHVQHDVLLKFLGHRISDERVLRLVSRLLKAGVMEEGQWLETDEGTPQGGSLSPMLANIYLHYALDLWATKKFRKGCTGVMRLIRYVDDFVVCFGKQADAERFRQELETRLAPFGLEVEPTKTKVLAFGPEAYRKAREAGTKTETFDFLGFTHYCGLNRNKTGFRMKRKTAQKKFRAKVAALNTWLRENRMKYKTRVLWEKVAAKLRGHYAYYGITDNIFGIKDFGKQAQELLHKWLNRRGGRKPMTWEKFGKMEKRFPFPRPRISVHMFEKRNRAVQGYLPGF
ncbi:MAG: group II intron reverse transcriptase/maturase [Kiritimatiellae bacterium]|nr:group II intron reverse transcriptase/maturase [Kiritimatiellia bacterium]